MNFRQPIFGRESNSNGEGKVSDLRSENYSLGELGVWKVLFFLSGAIFTCWPEGVHSYHLSIVDL